MADFGPKIFHATSKYADAFGNNTFITEAWPPRIGLHLIDPHNNRPTTMNMERIKNGIFKLFLARGRNILHKEHEAGSNEVTVTLTLTFKNESFHAPVHRLAGNLVVHEAEYDDLFDTQDIIGALESQSAACGPRNRLDAANVNDQIYNALTW